MMRIYDGRKRFYQWDINQKITSDKFNVGDEIHFANATQDSAYVVEAYELEGLVVADVPNILLQAAFPIKAYRYIEDNAEGRTIEERMFSVLKREKPDDYVYTETETETYQRLKERVDELERNGVSEEQIAVAVEKYLDENPVDDGVKFTTGNALELTPDNVLNVRTTNDAEPDNTLPITSSGVNTIVGNIGAILDTI